MSTRERVGRKHAESEPELPQLAAPSLASRAAPGTVPTSGLDAAGPGLDPEAPARETRGEDADVARAHAGPPRGGHSFAAMRTHAPAADAPALLAPAAPVVLSEPGEPAEQEAERVAEEVVAGDGERVAVTTGAGRSEVRRKRGGRPDADAAAGGAVDAPPDDGESAAPGVAVHDALRTEGQPLDGATRASMEPRFGHDFSRIRIHTDEAAAASVSGWRAETLRANGIEIHVVPLSAEARARIEAAQARQKRVNPPVESAEPGG